MAADTPEGPSGPGWVRGVYAIAALLTALAGLITALVTVLVLVYGGGN